jgi:hypothetical protein
MAGFAMHYSDRHMRFFVSFDLCIYYESACRSKQQNNIDSHLTH